MALIGEICVPSELIVPDRGVSAANHPTLSGALFISGAKLYIRVGTKAEIITST